MTVPYSSIDRGVDRDFWLNRWRENRIGFHLSEVNPLLQRFHDDAAAKPGRVLVPLCGKSRDLAWLMEMGHDVTGVDLSPIAAKSFMAEQNLSAQTADEPPFAVLRAARMTYYIGDFFDLQPARAGRFDLIYDRAALIAIPAGLRPAYAARLRSLMAPGGTILLISLEYDTDLMKGPPHAVGESEIRGLLAGLTVEKLHEHDCLDTEPRFKDQGHRWLKETVFRIPYTT